MTELTITAEDGGRRIVARGSAGEVVAEVRREAGGTTLRTPHGSWGHRNGVVTDATGTAVVTARRKRVELLAGDAIPVRRRGRTARFGDLAEARGHGDTVTLQLADALQVRPDRELLTAVFVSVAAGILSTALALPPN